MAATSGDHDEQRQPLISGDDHPSLHRDDPRGIHFDDSDRTVSQQVQLSNGRRKPLKATEKMWVIATTTLISFLAFSSQLFVLIPYWLDTPGVTWAQMALYLIPFNLGVAAIFYNYYLVVFTHPGSVPTGWEPEWDAIAGVEVKASTGQPRYCKVCRSYKPPRAHHCRTCKRCVLRMDHHCPWVANCVGHGNYGHFLRFLWAVDYTMAIHITLLCLRVADWWSPMVLWREPSTTDMVLMILNFAQGLPVLLMVGIFSLYHTYALCTNTTTIESWEKDKVATLIRRGKIEEVKYPYDLGIKRNIQSILGPTTFLWCWPGAPPMGNGMDYSPGQGHDWRDQFYWPPRDPTRTGGRRMRTKQRHQQHYQQQQQAAGPFTYGGDGFNPALVPSNSARLQAAAAAAADAGSNPTAPPSLRKRNSSSPSGCLLQNEWSNASPYHPNYGQPPHNDEDDEDDVSSAEEAGVVDAGCIPTSTPWRGASNGGSSSKSRQRQRSKSAIANKDDDEESAEEHELLAAREARRWGQGGGSSLLTPSSSAPQQREMFPRLWPEDDESVSEDDDSSHDADADGNDNEDDDQPIGTSLGQLRSRVRRGSEGYEVRPMMYDRAYAAQLEDEEERLRTFLMRERERLGTHGADEYEQMYGAGAGASGGMGYVPPQEDEDDEDELH